MKCVSCGAEIPDTSKFCRYCGESQTIHASDLQENEVGYGQSQNNVIYLGPTIRNYNPEKDYNPIGMWGYFLYTILFCIPIVGTILLILFALGVTNNINLRNYARSWFCLPIILLIIVLILFITGQAGVLDDIFLSLIF